MKVLCLILSHPQFNSWKQPLRIFLAVSSDCFFHVSKVIAKDFDLVLLYLVPSFLSILISCSQEEGLQNPAEARQPACLECCGEWVRASNRGCIKGSLVCSRARPQTHHIVWNLKLINYKMDLVLHNSLSGD